MVLLVLPALILLPGEPLSRAISGTPRTRCQIDRRQLFRLVAEFVAQLAHEGGARSTLQAARLVALGLACFLAERVGQVAIVLHSCKLGRPIDANGSSPAFARLTLLLLLQLPIHPPRPFGDQRTRVRARSRSGGLPLVRHGELQQSIDLEAELLVQRTKLFEDRTQAYELRHDRVLAHFHPARLEREEKGEMRAVREQQLQFRLEVPEPAADLELAGVRSFDQRRHARASLVELRLEVGQQLEQLGRVARHDFESFGCAESLLAAIYNVGRVRPLPGPRCRSVGGAATAFHLRNGLAAQRDRVKRVVERGERAARARPRRRLGRALRLCALGEVAESLSVVKVVILQQPQLRSLQPARLLLLELVCALVLLHVLRVLRVHVVRAVVGGLLAAPLARRAVILLLPIPLIVVVGEVHAATGRRLEPLVDIVIVAVIILPLVLVVVSI
mmetsp:Transcript_36910/g.91873  ORF Transcript_36910/g.91873 Transcript_36910/m.91873 type:complete len:446 (-) Transcript_36910:261-1598(-)